MKLSDVFTSSYLKAADLNGKEPTLTIESVVFEEIGPDRERKLVMYFQGAKKGLILNKTNAMNIGNYYGDDTDHWIGKPVVLFTAWVDFQGRTTQALRLRVPTSSTPPAPQDNPVQNDPVSDLDDEIPF